MSGETGTGETFAALGRTEVAEGTLVTCQLARQAEVLGGGAPGRFDWNVCRPATGKLTSFQCPRIRTYGQRTGSAHPAGPANAEGGKIDPGSFFPPFFARRGRQPSGPGTMRFASLRSSSWLTDRGLPRTPTPAKLRRLAIGGTRRLLARLAGDRLSGGRGDVGNLSTCPAGGSPWRRGSWPVRLERPPAGHRQVDKFPMSPDQNAVTTAI
jgi:hypothetical protein